MITRADVTLRLLLIGTTVGVVAGVLVGVASAIRQYRFGDYVATVFSFVVLSIPVFVMAQLLKFGGLQLKEAAGTPVTLFAAVLILISGWLSDLLYAALDPRIRVT